MVFYTALFCICWCKDKATRKENTGRNPEDKRAKIETTQQGHNMDELMEETQWLSHRAYSTEPLMYIESLLCAKRQYIYGKFKKSLRIEYLFDGGLENFSTKGFPRMWTCAFKGETERQRGKGKYRRPRIRSIANRSSSNCLMLDELKHEKSSIVTHTHSHKQTHAHMQSPPYVVWLQSVLCWRRLRSEVSQCSCWSLLVFQGRRHYERKSIFRLFELKKEDYVGIYKGFSDIQIFRVKPRKTDYDLPKLSNSSHRNLVNMISYYHSFHFSMCFTYFPKVCMQESTSSFFS